MGQKRGQKWVTFWPIFGQKRGPKSDRFTFKMGHFWGPFLVKKWDHFLALFGHFWSPYFGPWTETPLYAAPNIPNWPKGVKKGVQKVVSPIICVNFGKIPTNDGRNPDFPDFQVAGKRTGFDTFLGPKIDHLGSGFDRRNWAKWPIFDPKKWAIFRTPKWPKTPFLDPFFDHFLRPFFMRGLSKSGPPVNPALKSGVLDRPKPGLGKRAKKWTPFLHSF